MRGDPSTGGGAAEQSRDHAVGTVPLNYMGYPGADTAGVSPLSTRNQIVQRRTTTRERMDFAKRGFEFQEFRLHSLLNCVGVQIIPCTQTIVRDRNNGGIYLQDNKRNPTAHVKLHNTATIFQKTLTVAS